MDFGRRPALRGRVSGVGAGTAVEVQRRDGGAWVTAGRAATRVGGVFALTTPALRAGTVFRALAGAAVSPVVPIQVRPVVAVGRRGSLLTVRVRPGRAGTTVRLERLGGVTRSWMVVGRAHLAGGRSRFTLGSPGAYRATVGAQPGLTARSSRVVVLRG